MFVNPGYLGLRHSAEVDNNAVRMIPTLELFDFNPYTKIPQALYIPATLKVLQIRLQLRLSLSALSEVESNSCCSTGV